MSVSVLTTSVICLPRNVSGQVEFIEEVQAGEIQLRDFDLPCCNLFTVRKQFLLDRFFSVMRFCTVSV